MDQHRDRLQQRLALAERDVAQRARLINGQHAHICALERRGAHCVQAKRLLALLEKTQAQQAKHRELVLAQLMVLRRILADTAETPPSVELAARHADVALIVPPQSGAVLCLTIGRGLARLNPSRRHAERPPSKAARA